MHFRRSIIALGLLAGLLAGCAQQPRVPPPLDGRAVSVELRDTPFFPQERYQCGPAALATVLTESGAAVDVPTLVRRVYVPARRGSLQVEMLAAIRSAGRVPYLIDGDLRSIGAELQGGRPVLVLQNLGVSWLPRWHYAVVVGIDTSRNEIILRSGIESRRRTGIQTFLRTWHRSNAWGLVVLGPGELPANPEPRRFAAALADMEETGQPAIAEAGWRRAALRWPDDAVVLFGLANAEMRAERYRQAEGLYRRILAIDAGHWGALNNLAYALQALDRASEALALLGAAIEHSGDGPGREMLEQSLRDIRRSDAL